MFPVIFIGTSDFSVKCLECLLESNFFKVQAVITIPDRQKNRGMKWQSSAVKVFSEKRSFPLLIPDRLSDEDFLKKVSQIKSECSIVCDYGKILPKSFLQIFPKKSVNVHPSLLPLWRGAAPIQRALMNGNSQTGVSLQFVEEKLDSGDIIGKISFSIEEDETAEDIYKKAEEASKVLLQKDLVSYFKGELKPEPQSEEQASYAHKIRKEESKIDWKKDAQTIHNQVRALVLGPQAFTLLEAQRLKIYKTKIVNLSSFQDKAMLHKPLSSFSPGEVVVLNKKQVIVSCGKLALSLLEVQREGRKRQKIEEFLKGTFIQWADTFQS